MNTLKVRSLEASNVFHQLDRSQAYKYSYIVTSCLPGIDACL